MVQNKTQFALIQALRGLAAFWVVLFHLNQSQYNSGLTEVLPKLLVFFLFELGSSGVAIFFVLSGFVIWHSLASKPMTGRDLLQFGARRSIRLDPPYWITIGLSVAVATLIASIHDQDFALPSASTLIWHILYFQEIVATPQINLVFWTLTYEFQFYLVLAVAQFLATRTATNGLRIEQAQIAWGIPLATLAFIAAVAPSGWAPRGLFVDLWHAFFLGILAYRAGHQRQSPILLFCLIIATLVGAQYREGLFDIPAALTALALFVAGRTGYLINGLNRIVLQFLGKISYSLYLVHVPLMMIGFGLWGRLAGRGGTADILGILVVCPALLLAAYLFWWLFERPSHKLALSLFRVSPRNIPQGATLSPMPTHQN